MLCKDALFADATQQCFAVASKQLMTCNARPSEHAAAWKSMTHHAARGINTSLLHVPMSLLPADESPPPWRDMSLSKAQRQAAWFAVNRPERRLPQLRPDGSKVPARELMVRRTNIHFLRD